MSAPYRVQLSRKKGWRKPENTVVVARPSKWGNPFTIGSFKQVRGGRREFSVNLMLGAQPYIQFEHNARTIAVEEFRRLMALPRPIDPRDLPWWLIERQTVMIDNLNTLRGKNLACWCPLTDADGNRVACHADVLLEIANEVTS